jgi:hypothetical protein
VAGGKCDRRQLEDPTDRVDHRPWILARHADSLVATEHQVTRVEPAGLGIEVPELVGRVAGQRYGLKGQAHRGAHMQGRSLAPESSAVLGYLARPPKASRRAATSEHRHATARECSRAATVILVMVAKHQRIEPPTFEPPLQRVRRVGSSRVHEDAADVPCGDLIARGGEAAEGELDSAAVVVDNQVHAIMLRSPAPPAL